MQISICDLCSKLTEIRVCWWASTVMHRAIMAVRDGMILFKTELTRAIILPRKAYLFPSRCDTQWALAICTAIHVLTMVHVLTMIHVCTDNDSCVYNDSCIYRQ